MTGNIDTEATKKAIDAFAIRAREVLWDAATRSEVLFSQGNIAGSDLIMNEAHEMLMGEIQEIIIRECFIKPTMAKVAEILSLAPVNNPTK